MIMLPLPTLAEQDIAGVWILSGPGTESEVLLTAEGVRIQAEYDLLVDDPSLYCTPASAARVWANPNALIKIEQSSRAILISYELFDLRREIPFADETELPDQPSTRNLAGRYFPEMGSSVATFEADRLVVLSKNHAPGFIRTSRGIPQSASTVTREEFSLQQDGLKIIHTYEDPKLFEKPLVLEYFFKRSTATDVALYDCTDANYDWFNELNEGQSGANP
jgi:hypothetical protein